MIVSANSISKNYQQNNLFKNISFSIKAGDKIGLIGVNGCGKSTLLKIIAQLETPDRLEHQQDGEMIFAPKKEILYVPQVPIFTKDMTVIDYVIANSKNESELFEAKSILNKLGIDDYDQKIQNLSGGNKKRVSLACGLIQKCDLLILDEPTNHLDEHMVVWLENYLNKRIKTLIMVTHDRYFLQKVTNQIYEIDDNSLFQYEGNYEQYLTLKQQRYDQMQASQRKLNSFLVREEKWIKQGAKARSSKSKDRIQRFEKLSKSANVKPTSELDINSVNSRLGSKVINIDNVAFSYGEKQLFKNFSYNFTKYDRIGIVGPNGAGKTTLLNLMTNNLQPTSGTVDIGSTVKFGFFKQDQSDMPFEDRVLDYLTSFAEFIETPTGPVSAASLLKRFQFPTSLHYTPIKNLSGGQQRRLYLLTVLIQAPNVLILDEPTNDFDITTLSILEEFLDNFQGVIIVVSHDRYFLDQTVDSLFILKPDQEIEHFIGDFSSYLISDERGDNTNKKQKAKSDVKKSNDNVNKITRYKFSYKEQNEFNTIDEDIINIETEIAQIDQQIATNTDFSLINDLLAKRTVLQDKLDEKNERWIYLYDLHEKIENQKS